MLSRSALAALAVGAVAVLVGLGDGGDGGAGAADDVPTAAPSGRVAGTRTARPVPHAVKPSPTSSPQSSPRSSPKAPPTSSVKVSPRPRPPSYVVSRVVDGDTIELASGATVRLVGIDTPERGQCGYDEASRHLADLVLGRRVVLRVSDEDVDRYGRLLRYVDIPAAQSAAGRVVDAGLNQIRSGYAIARYDSRDGYGFHPREPEYVRSDLASKGFSCGRPQPLVHQPAATAGRCMAGYRPCLPVTADLDCGDIGHPVTVTGSDPYRLDGDGDGVGCD